MIKRYEAIAAVQRAFPGLDGLTAEVSDPQRPFGLGTPASFLVHRADRQRRFVRLGLSQPESERKTNTAAGPNLFSRCGQGTVAAASFLRR